MSLLRINRTQPMSAAHMLSTMSHTYGRVRTCVVCRIWGGIVVM